MGAGSSSGAGPDVVVFTAASAIDGAAPDGTAPRAGPPASWAVHPLQHLVLGGLQQHDDWNAKIEQILLSKTEQKVFQVFLRDEFCDEMLSFWRAADVYQAHACKFAAVMKQFSGERANVQRLDEMRLANPHVIKIATIVFDHFVSPSGPEAVTFSDKLIRKIKKELKSGTVTTELFLDASREVKKLLATDKLPRFKQWVLTEAALQKIVAKCGVDGDTGLLCQDSETESQLAVLEGLSEADPSGSDFGTPTGAAASRRASWKGGPAPSDSRRNSECIAEHLPRQSDDDRALKAVVLGMDDAFITALLEES
ncbi:hypothetical protein M885DRAFT_516506 [Pelagophyceae sp. CCMP2097]|nr:hypothetical protein M885DRAFT_516506 [Pelagophyceae sp. CCMP2097]